MFLLLFTVVFQMDLDHELTVSFCIFVPLVNICTSILRVQYINWDLMSDKNCKYLPLIGTSSHVFTQSDKREFYNTTFIVYSKTM